MSSAATETPAAMLTRRRSPAWAWAALLVAFAMATPILAVLVTAAAPGGPVSYTHLTLPTICSV